MQTPNTAKYQSRGAEGGQPAAGASSTDSQAFMPSAVEWRQSNGRSLRDLFSCVRDEHGESSDCMLLEAPSCGTDPYAIVHPLDAVQTYYQGCLDESSGESGKAKFMSSAVEWLQSKGRSVRNLLSCIRDERVGSAGYTLLSQEEYTSSGAEDGAPAAGASSTASQTFMSSAVKWLQSKGRSVRDLFSCVRDEHGGSSGYTLVLDGSEHGPDPYDVATPPGVAQTFYQGCHGGSYSASGKANHAQSMTRQSGLPFNIFQGTDSESQFDLFAGTDSDPQQSPSYELHGTQGKVSLPAQGRLRNLTGLERL